MDVDRDEEFGRRLILAIPASSEAVAAHRRDYGGIRPVELLRETLQLASWEVRQGDGDRLDRLAGFIGTLLDAPDPELGDAAVRGFVDPVATWAEGRPLDDLMASWPSAVRDAVADRRGRRVRVLARAWAEFEAADGDGPAVDVAWALPGRWEALGTDGDVLYAAGDEVVAIDLHEVRRRWEYPGHGDVALESGGGVALAQVGSGALQVFAPFEHCVRLDRSTGAEIAWSAQVTGEDPSGDTRPFPESRVRDFVVERLEAATVEVRDASGRLMVTVDSDSAIDPPAPLQIGDLLILPLGSGDLLALRRRTSES